MKEKETVKGYKAFSPGFYCEHDGNRKQYYENSVAEDEGANSCCSKGVMHFCETPFDCLDYYPLITEDDKFTEFAPVEALDEVLIDGNKRATKKLRIGAKLDFSGFVKAGVDVLIESTKLGKINATTNNDNGRVGAKIGSSGVGAKIGSSGNYAKIDASSKDSIASAIGVNSIAKAAAGCWIVLAEHDEWNGSYYPVKCVRAAQVDGTTIKPDTWYKLENGEFVDVSDE